MYIMYYVYTHICTIIWTEQVVSITLETQVTTIKEKEAINLTGWEGAMGGLCGRVWRKERKEENDEIFF